MNTIFRVLKWRKSRLDPMGAVLQLWEGQGNIWIDSTSCWLEPRCYFLQCKWRFFSWYLQKFWCKIFHDSLLWFSLSFQPVSSLYIWFFDCLNVICVGSNPMDHRGMDSRESEYTDKIYSESHTIENFIERVESRDFICRSFCWAIRWRISG